MNYDELNPILKEHGARIGVPHDPIRHYSGPVEHVSDEEAVRRDHGAGICIKESGIVTYGTDDVELKKIFQTLLYADGVGDISFQVSKLPDASIIKIIEQRYRKTSSTLADNGRVNGEILNNLGKNLDVDFAIIMESIRQKREIFSPFFDKSYFVVKEDKTDIIGLIQGYKESIEKFPVGINLIDGMTGKEHIDANTGIVMDSMTGLYYLMTEAKKVALEKGIELSSKSL